MPERPAGQRELRVKEMIAWLDDHYAEPVTIARLASAAGICVRECQFAKQFKIAVGVTPREYRKNLTY